MKMFREMKFCKVASDVFVSVMYVLFCKLKIISVTIFSVVGWFAWSLWNDGLYVAAGILVVATIAIWWLDKRDHPWGAKESEESRRLQSFFAGYWLGSGK